MSALHNKIIPLGNGMESVDNETSKPQGGNQALHNQLECQHAYYFPSTLKLGINRTLVLLTELAPPYLP